MLLQVDLLGPTTLPLLLIVAGLVISIMEALAPGAHLVVVGVALLAAGLVGLLLGPFAGPFVLGVLVMIFGALAFYGYRELDVYGGKGQRQTRDSTALQGATGRVTERVTPTGGQIKLDAGGFNPYYSARTVEGDLAEGTEVVVLDPGGGNVLTVESIEPDMDEIDRELARGREGERAEGRERDAGRSGAGDGGQDDETARESERERETE